MPMNTKRWYAEQIHALIKAAEADGYHVSADWEEIRIGKPGDKWGYAATVSFNYTGNDTGWELT